MGGVLAAASLVAPFAQRASALDGSFDWVSRDYNGGELDDLNNGAAGVRQGISSDGRYVLFDSAATDVVSGDTNGFRDMFRRDRQTGTTTLVSVDSSGQQGNNDVLNGDGAISGDGRYVVFPTYATNFASPDFNNDADLFIRDTQAGTTTRICSSQYSGYSCNNSSISRDGRYVTFKLIDPFNYGGQGQIFRYDRTTGINTLVTQTSLGQTANANVDGWSRMSADGRYVVFGSLANNLVANDTNNKFDIFRRDMQTGDIVRVNTTPAGAEANSDSQWPTISDDGRYIAFATVASNFAANDTNNDWDLFVKDLDQNTVQTVGGALNSALGGTITGDASKVVFDTSAQGFSPNDTNNYQDAYAWDRVANTNRRLSERPDGSELGYFGVIAGAPSIDGRYTQIFTNDTIDAGDTQGAQDVYVYDRGPDAPTNLTATSPTMKPILTWNAVTGATSYNVYRNGTNIGSTASTSYTDTTAPNGTVGYYVKAVDGGGAGAASNTINVVVDTVKPTMNFTAPASFATPFTTGPTVTVAASDTGSGLQNMVIHVYNSSNQLLGICGSATPSQLSAGTMSCDLSSLSNGTYSIKAGTFDNAGNNKTLNSGTFVISH
jgi:hypothetical protein